VVRARCERTAVEPCQVTFDQMAEYGLVTPILLVRVRWRRAIGWVCKSEAAGSNPARSISRSGSLQDFRVDGANADNGGASAVRADPSIRVGAVE
jgi:hypothetical protein